MFFAFSIIFAVLLVLALIVSIFAPPDRKSVVHLASLVLAVLAFGCFGLSTFTSVAASHIGVVTSFGQAKEETLPEGAHMIWPWQKVTEVYMGQQQATTPNSQAASKDIQSVHTVLALNYTVTPGEALALYRSNTTLTYNDLLVLPAALETFKDVVSHYTAEELVTKRQEVSNAITGQIAAKLKRYHLTVQNVNLIDFGFSRSFDAAIEEKVTANQKAQTAENNLKKVRFEADARIAQAEGEAKAIAIQSAAVEKSGGTGYVQLQAIQKWDGKLPTYMTAGAAAPFIGVK